jgi:hypothetical protein
MCTVFFSHTKSASLGLSAVETISRTSQYEIAVCSSLEGLKVSKYNGSLQIFPNMKRSLHFVDQDLACNYRRHCTIGTIVTKIRTLAQEANHYWGNGERSLRRRIRSGKGIGMDDCVRRLPKLKAKVSLHVIVITSSYLHYRDEHRQRRGSSYSISSRSRVQIQKLRKTKTKANCKIGKGIFFRVPNFSCAKIWH